MPDAIPTRTLVAVHGNFASAAWWRDLVARPPAGWQVLAPDLPGFAGTPYGGDVSISVYADWLGAWIAERNLDRPVLLGHSLGGAVVLDLAARDPGRYRALVLAASAPLTGLVTPEENYPVLEMLRGSPALLEMSLGALFPSGRPADFGEYVQDGGRMAATHYSGNARALSTWSVDPARLSGLPVLVMGGELDALITPDMVRAQAQALGVPATVQPGVGHGFPQEQPDVFRAALATFLDSLP